MNIRDLRSLFLVLLLCPFASGSAAADDDPYTFEMIVFERPGGGGGEDWTASPDNVAPSVAPALATLPAMAKSMDAVAYTLKKKGMIVHEHLAWLQTPASLNSETWYSLNAGRLSGMIRLTRGRYLHLDTDLRLADASLEFPLRVQLRRRMRSGELHYVDHPKLGILIQAERYQPAPEPAAPGEGGNGEPKPVQPVGAASTTAN